MNVTFRSIIMLVKNMATKKYILALTLCLTAGLSYPMQPPVDHLGNLLVKKSRQEFLTLTLTQEPQTETQTTPLLLDPTPTIIIPMLWDDLGETPETRSVTVIQESQTETANGSVISSKICVCVVWGAVLLLGYFIHRI